jgi:hypothetical protein
LKTPHKHADLIKAWADGAEIEYLNIGSASVWASVTSPRWDGHGEYRIKPEPKLDIEKYCRATSIEIDAMTSHLYELDNLKLTFDGETGKLKAAEVIA